MKRKLVAIASLIVPLFSYAFAGFDQDAAFFLAQGHDRHGSVKELFKDRSHSDCENLAHHPKLQVALYAKWMAVRKADALESTKESRRLARAEFCGFVSARLGMPVPNWWQAGFLGATVKETVENKSFVESNAVRHLPKIKLAAVSDQAFSVETNGKHMEVEFHAGDWDRAEVDGFFDPKSRADCLAFETAVGDRRVFAVLGGDALYLQVFCTDSSGKGLWTKSVGKCRQVRLITNHSPRGLIQLCSNDDHVAVFWQNEVELTVDVFDISTGDLIAGFTTFVDDD